MTIEAPPHEIAVPLGEPAVASSPPDPGANPSPRPRLGLRRTDIGALMQRGLALFSAAVVALFVFMVLFSGLEHGRAQRSLERRLRRELANAQAPISGDIAIGAPVFQLSIPDIGVREAVVEGTTSGVTRRGPGHLPASSFPGQIGNTVIVGRRSTYGGPFGHIGSLQVGDRIDVTSGQGTATYEVERVAKCGSKDGRFLLPLDHPTLTLVTADPAFFASRRLVVTAKLETQPFATTDHTTKLGANELGLDGDPGGVVALVVWLEALLVVAIGGVWLFRRWNLWTAYVVVVPVVLAVSWLVFDSASVLFPATL